MAAAEQSAHTAAELSITQARQHNELLLVVSWPVFVCLLSLFSYLKICFSLLGGALAASAACRHTAYAQQQLSLIALPPHAHTLWLEPRAA